MFDCTEFDDAIVIIDRVVVVSKFWTYHLFFCFRILTWHHLHYHQLSRRGIYPLGYMRRFENEAAANSNCISNEQRQQHNLLPPCPAWYLPSPTHESSLPIAPSQRLPWTWLQGNKSPLRRVSLSGLSYYIMCHDTCTVRLHARLLLLVYITCWSGAGSYSSLFLLVLMSIRLTGLCSPRILCVFLCFCKWTRRSC